MLKPRALTQTEGPKSHPPCDLRQVPSPPDLRLSPGEGVPERLSVARPSLAAQAPLLAFQSRQRELAHQTRHFLGILAQGTHRTEWGAALSEPSTGGWRGAGPQHARVQEACAGAMINSNSKGPPGARGAGSRVPWTHWWWRTPLRPGQERGCWARGREANGAPGLTRPAGVCPHRSLEATLPPPRPDRAAHSWLM